jgi:hypothetical protein
MSSPSEPTGKSTSFEARTTVNWDARNSQLAIETNSVGKESGDLAECPHYRQHKFERCIGRNYTQTSNLDLVIC